MSIRKDNFINSFLVRNGILSAPDPEQEAKKALQRMLEMVKCALIDNRQLQKINNRLAILASLAPSNGVYHTTTQIQKLLFLVDRSIPNLVQGPHFNFQAGPYGPIDNSIPTVLEDLVGEMLLHCTYVKNKKYSLTPRGQEIGIGALDSISIKVKAFIFETSKFVLSLSFPQLVSAIYKAYPDMTENGVFKSVEGVCK